jgi:hypothetical protein
LQQSVPEGGTLADAFAQYLRNTGKRHPEDKGPIVRAPNDALYLLDWFWEISAGRPVGPVGLLGLPAVEIAEWSRLNRVVLKPWEFHALRRIDAKFMQVMNEQR